ncbi:hypothetical protein Q5752_005871 [Cryptotrichosporon argae]
MRLLVAGVAVATTAAAASQRHDLMRTQPGSPQASETPARWGYHGQYHPRPGSAYLMVGCDVFDASTPADSAVPLPAGRPWWHNYNNGLPAHLADVARHSIVLQRTDLEGWIVPDSIDVLPPPNELLTDVEARAELRVEYAAWLAGQTVGSAAWLAAHPEGLPYIPPPRVAAPRGWTNSLPDDLREFAKTTPVTYAQDGDNWLQPGSVDFPALRNRPVDAERLRLADEVKAWAEAHMTSGHGVAAAHRQLEARCGRGKGSVPDTPGPYSGPVWGDHARGNSSVHVGAGAVHAGAGPDEQVSEPVLGHGCLLVKLHDLAAAQSTFVLAVVGSSIVLVLFSLSGLVRRRIAASRSHTCSDAKACAYVSAADKA